MSKQVEKKEHETFVRFREFVKDKNIEIAKKLQVEPATVTNWRWRGIAHDKIIALAQIYGLDAHYISTGERSVQNQVNNQHGYIGASVNQSVVNNYASQLTGGDDWLTIVNNDMLPAFAIGDRVRIDAKKEVQAGNYVYVDCEGKKMLRKYRPKGFDEHGTPYTHLVAENEDYPVIDSRHQAFMVLGVAVEHKRRLV